MDEAGYSPRPLDAASCSHGDFRATAPQVTVDFCMAIAGSPFQDCCCGTAMMKVLEAMCELASQRNDDSVKASPRG